MGQTNDTFDADDALVKIMFYRLAQGTLVDDLAIREVAADETEWRALMNELREEEAADLRDIASRIDGLVHGAVEKIETELSSGDAGSDRAVVVRKDNVEAIRIKA